MRLIIVLLMLGLFMIPGCGTSHRGSTLPSPTPPPQLMSLPQAAQVFCYHDPNLDRGTVNVWELPGLEPSDANSAYQGGRGQLRGKLSPCTPVKISKYTWSESDQEFYVYVEAADVQGWVVSDLISFKPTPN
jgi:hypothetical protein